MNMEYLKELSQEELSKEFRNARYGSVEYQMILAELGTRKEEGRWKNG